MPKKLGSSGKIKRFVASTVSGTSGTHPFSFELSTVYENYQNITASDIIGGIYNVSTKPFSALIRSGSASFEEITSYNQKTGVINATVNISSQNNNVNVTVTPCFYIVV